MSDDWLLNFQFDGLEIREKYNVRVTGTFKDPWFVTKDICDILDIKNNRDVISKFPDKWKGVVKTDTLGGDQTMSTVNESGLYKLVMRSNKPIAIKFQEWICEIVIPSIRKTGEYKMIKSIEDELSKRDSIIESQNKKIDSLDRVLSRKLRHSYKKGDTIYVVRQQGTNYYKIGITNNLNSRLSTLDTGNSTELEVVYHRLTYANLLAESMIKGILILYRMRLFNEFFVLDNPSILITEIDTVCDFVEGRVKTHSNQFHTELLPETDYSCLLDKTTNDITREQSILQSTVKFENPPMTKEIYDKIRKEHGMEAVKEYVETGEIKETLITDSITKKCSRCKEIRPLAHKNFHKSKVNKSGYEGVCVPCKNKRNRDNYERKRPVKEEPEFVLLEEGEEIEIPDESKSCKQCGVIQPISNYYTSPDNKDGHINICSGCKSLQNKKRYEQDKIRTELYKDGKKPCKVCEEIKTLDNYWKIADNRDGLDVTCKDCKKIRRDKRKDHKLVITEKVCKECETEKVVSEFYVASDMADGYTNRCKVCYNAHQKELREKRLQKK